MKTKEQLFEEYKDLIAKWLEFNASLETLADTMSEEDQDQYGEEPFDGYHWGSLTTGYFIGAGVPWQDAVSLEIYL